MFRTTTQRPARAEIPKCSKSVASTAHPILYSEESGDLKCRGFSGAVRVARIRSGFAVERPEGHGACPDAFDSPGAPVRTHENHDKTVHAACRRCFCKDSGCQAVSGAQTLCSAIAQIEPGGGVPENNCAFAGAHEPDRPHRRGIDFQSDPR